MKTDRKTHISKALYEVWEWKDAVYKDIQHKCFEEKSLYFQEGVRGAVKAINGRLVKNADGTFSLKSKHTPQVKKLSSNKKIVS